MNHRIDHQIIQPRAGTEAAVATPSAAEELLDAYGDSQMSLVFHNSVMVSVAATCVVYGRYAWAAGVASVSLGGWGIALFRRLLRRIYRSS